MKKEIFENAVIEILMFGSDDILTASDPDDVFEGENPYNNGMIFSLK